MGIESRRGAFHSLPLLTRLSIARSTSSYRKKNYQVSTSTLSFLFFFLFFSQLKLCAASFVPMPSGRNYWCTRLNCAIGCATYIVCLSIFGRVTTNEPRTRATREKNCDRNVHTVELRGESRAIVTLRDRARA